MSRTLGSKLCSASTETPSASISGGSGRTAQVSYNLDVSAEYFSESAVSAVAGVAETDKFQRRRTEKARALFFAMHVR